MPNLSPAFKKIWFCRENPDSLKPTVHYYFNGINISQYLYTCILFNDENPNYLCAVRKDNTQNKSN